MIENTSDRDPIIHALGSMDGPGSFGRYVEGMESAGQAQLVASEVLPARCPEAELTALGFKLGEPVDGDPLFRHAELPAGWRKVGSDHAMWSYIEDDHGRRRVAIFYKAAFYDRDAFARLETPYSYAFNVLAGTAELVLDETWATRAAMREAFEHQREECERYLAMYEDRDDDYAKERVVEYRAQIERAGQLIATLTCDGEAQDANGQSLRCLRPPGHDGYHWFDERPNRQAKGGEPRG